MAFVQKQKKKEEAVDAESGAPPKSQATSETIEAAPARGRFHSRLRVLNQKNGSQTMILELPTNSQASNPEMDELLKKLEQRREAEPDA